MSSSMNYHINATQDGHTCTVKYEIACTYIYFMFLDYSRACDIDSYDKYVELGIPAVYSIPLYRQNRPGITVYRIPVYR